jgi:hypothetical protein
MNNLTENNLPTADQQPSLSLKGQLRDKSQLNKVNVNTTIMNTQMQDEGASIQHTSMVPENFATYQNIIEHEGKGNL